MFSIRRCRMNPASISVFMVGDVMLARGIDMIQETSCDPTLYESNGLNAHDYVKLAIDENSAIPDKCERGVDYVWGDTIGILAEKNPDVRIINLETSVTTSSTPWPGKGIHYRMHPENVQVIKSARIDCCSLANNHVVDWGFPGLLETLGTLRDAKIATAGAGENSATAKAPAVIDLPEKSARILVFAGGHESSGVLPSWRAKSNREGVHIIEVTHAKRASSELHDLIKKCRRDQDVVLLSLHWGGNWGWDVDPRFREFAHRVIDESGVDVIYGHSSHHVKGIEVYNKKLIIYGCGDFLNDYEGITGHEEFRDDLSLMYFADVCVKTGQLLELKMVPTQIKHLQVHKAKEEGIQWLERSMSRECQRLGTIVKRVGQELHLVF